jgi:integrase
VPFQTGSFKPIKNIMASLQKRGKYYYGRWQKIVKDEHLDVRKSLGIRHKLKAKEALEKLEDLEEEGQIDPYSRSFDPKQTLKELNSNDELAIRTMREAADYFYMKKSHLSDKTVKNSGSGKQSDRGAYERAIEHFLKKNELANTPPKLVRKHHFEAIIFKKGIKMATRRFYFRQLRAFWNKLLEWKIVENNYLKAIKNDLPDQKSNIRPKMLSKKELVTLFKAFDKDLKRKRARPDWDENLNQHWFKPVMAIYFYCGLRKNELCFDSGLDYSGLQGKNLQYYNDELAIITLPATKGRKERNVPIPKECKNYLQSYLDIRGSLKPEDYVFIYMGGSRKGWPVTGNRAYRQFKHYLKIADLPKSRTLHGMRHERITFWLENGFNPAEAQFMAGHTSIRTTQGYTHLKGQNLYKKMKRMEGERG